MKRKRNKKSNQENFFNEMAYELAGDIGAIDNEEMINNEKLVTAQNKNARKTIKNGHENKKK